MTVIKSNVPADNPAEYIGDVASKHWHDLFREHFARDKERYDAMREIMQEHGGTSNFDPQTIALFQGLISQRYFANTPIFLNSEEVKDVWKQTESTENGLAFTLGKFQLFFPVLQTRTGSRPTTIPTFGFMSIPASTEYQGPLDPAILRNVKTVAAPAVLLKPDLITALEKYNLQDRFTGALSVVIEQSNHDFVHGLTNPNRDRNIPEAHDYKTKTYLRNFVNPEMANNGFVVEECAVIEMNRLIFERLRAQNRGCITTFIGAVNEVAAIITDLESKNEKTAAKQARFIVKNFLSFLFDKELLDKTPINQWGELVRTADTRQDIKICEYTTPRPFEVMGVFLRGEPSATKPVERPQSTPAEDDAVCAELLAAGTLRRVHPTQLYKSLSASVEQDMNGWMMRAGERTKILEAAHFDGTDSHRQTARPTKRNFLIPDGSRRGRED